MPKHQFKARKKKSKSNLANSFETIYQLWQCLTDDLFTILKWYFQESAQQMPNYKMESNGANLSIFLPFHFEWTSGQKKSQFDFVCTVFYLDLFGDCLVSVKFEIGLSLSQNFRAGAVYSTSFRKIC